jgi:hypothetical protein
VVIPITWLGAAVLAVVVSVGLLIALAGGLLALPVTGLVAVAALAVALLVTATLVVTVLIAVVGVTKTAVVRVAIVLGMALLWVVLEVVTVRLAVIEVGVVAALPLIVAVPAVRGIVTPLAALGGARPVAGSSLGLLRYEVAVRRDQQTSWCGTVPCAASLTAPEPPAHLRIYPRTAQQDGFGCSS